MATLSVASMLEYITSFIKAKYPTVDVQPGTDIYDVVFYASSQIARRVSDDIDSLQKNQSVMTTSSTDLDLVSRNYNKLRRPATYATGNVIFYTSSFSSDVLVPVNTIVSTAGTNTTPPIRFKTLKSVGMSVANKVTYYDSTALRYQVSTTIQAEVAGTSGNIDTQVISELVSTISGIDGVINEVPTTGGTEEETDASLRQRCLESFISSNIGTVYGYKKLITDEYLEVLDVKAIGPFDIDSFRDTGVDVFTIISEQDSVTNEVQFTETFTYNNGDIGYTSLYRPVITVDTLFGTSGGTTRTFIPYPNVDADYQFLRDYTGERAMSTGSADRIVWLSGIKPNNGSIVSITYTYNDKVRQIQEYLDIEENKVVGADALIKLGLEAKAYLRLSLGYFPGVDKEAAKTKVSSALSEFLSTYAFGEQLELSDLEIVAQIGKWTSYNITEIDYVVFDTTNSYVSIPEISLTKYFVNGVIDISINQYVRFGSVTIV